MGQMIQIQAGAIRVASKNVETFLELAMQELGNYYEEFFTPDEEETTRAYSQFYVDRYSEVGDSYPERIRNLCKVIGPHLVDAVTFTLKTENGFNEDAQKIFVAGPTPASIALRYQQEAVSAATAAFDIIPEEHATAELNAIRQALIDHDLTMQKATSAAPSIPSASKQDNNFPAKRLVIEAFASGKAETPEWGTVSVGVGTLEFIQRKAEACKDANAEILVLEPAAAGIEIPTWGPYSSSLERLQLQGDMLHVTPTNFWFEAKPKYSANTVYTSVVNMKALVNALKDSNSEPVLFYAREPDDLKRIWTGAQGDQQTPHESPTNQG